MRLFQLFAVALTVLHQLPVSSTPLHVLQPDLRDQSLLEVTAKPDGVKVVSLAGKMDHEDYKLVVFNKRLVDGSAPGGQCNCGKIKELVEYDNNELKSNSEYSGYHTQMTSVDKHSLPRSKFATKEGNIRRMFAATTVGKQIFMYKQQDAADGVQDAADGVESVIPKSGFTITYTTEVFIGGVKQLSGKHEVDVTSGVQPDTYVTLEITKKGADVTVGGHVVEAGTGSASTKFKLTPPAAGAASSSWVFEDIKI